MTLKSKPYNEQRYYHRKRWGYLLDDNDKTAWVVKGHIGRCKRFRIPDSIEIDGKNYTVTSIELGAFNNPKTLRHLTIPDSIEYVDEDEFVFLNNLRSVYVGKGVKHLTDWHFTYSTNLISTSKIFLVIARYWYLTTCLTITRGIQFGGNLTL